MSVTNINSKLVEYVLHPEAVALDANGNQLVVGAKYEIYTPVAKDAAEGIGLQFKDDVGYSFTYAGCVQMGDTLYLASPDVYYSDERVPRGITPALIALLTAEGAAHPVCPTFAAADFVRPATDG